jgi:hypothetical protein
MPMPFVIILLADATLTLRLFISFRQSSKVLWSAVMSCRCTIFRAMRTPSGSTRALYTVLNVPLPSTRSNTTRLQHDDCRRSSPLIVIIIIIIMTATEYYECIILLLLFSVSARARIARSNVCTAGTQLFDSRWLALTSWRATIILFGSQQNSSLK